MGKIENLSNVSNSQTVDNADNCKQVFSLKNLFGANTTVNSTVIRPSLIKDQEKQIINAIEQCDLIAKMNKEFHDQYIVRGNQALYKILSNIYEVAIKIDLSIAKDQIYKKMREILKERGIKTQTNTPNLTVLVKYIVGGDRKTATNYTRVLSVAIEENIAVNELAEYISRRGGIGQIYETEQKHNAKKLANEFSNDRLTLLREYFLLKQWEVNKHFEFDEPVVIHNADKKTSAETGDFCVFLTVWDDKSNVYRIVSANDLGKTYEDSLLRLMVKDAPKDIQTIKSGLMNYKRALLKKGLLPDMLAEITKKEITDASKSDKKKQTPVVIEQA